MRHVEEAHADDWDESWRFIGEVPETFDLGLRPPEPEPSIAEQLTGQVPPMSRGEILAARDGLLQAMHFRERYAKSQIESGVIDGVFKLARRLPDGALEHYSQKLANEAAKGKYEAASFGTGKIGEQDVVIFVMNWDVFAGSVGVVVGEKFQMATDLAREKKLPFIGMYSSSGVRQHENYAGLLQMQRMIEGQDNHLEHTSQPHVSIYVGQTWGGVSASVAPRGDTIIAVPGTRYGFSGPKVIEAYEGTPVEPAAQRVEFHASNRNVDTIVASGKVVDYLKNMFEASKADRHSQVMPEDIKDGAVTPNSEGVIAPDLTRSGILPIGTRALPNFTVREALAVADQENHSYEDELYGWYERLMRDSRHLDPEFFMRNSFDATVPFYNSYIADRVLHYPAIIASVGRIGLQPFLVVGSQPSYQKTHDDSLRRIPASPAPADLRYLRRMLHVGERWRLPVVFLGDTLGAKPTLEAECSNQMLEIGETIHREQTYEGPVMTVVTGALGSGGGLTVAPNVDYFAMLEKSLAFVAEPRSSTSILYSTERPAVDQIKLTLSTLGATAADQLNAGLSDETIPESVDPYQTARNVRNAIARAMLELQGLKSGHLHDRRRERLRSRRAVDIVHGH